MDRTKKIVGIYCITNIQNNKKYVGYSTNIKKRWGQHRDVLRRGVCKNTHIQAAYNLYGFNSFVYSILEELPAGLTKQEYEKCRQLYLEIAKKAVTLGGTVSAEHGIGKTKHPFAEAMLGKEGIEEMRRFKLSLDPCNILGQNNIFKKIDQ